jgi:hypothetical protein
MMKRILFALVLGAACGTAMADDRQACEAVDGSYLTGQVVTGPTFVHGQFRQGVELSHTHLKLHADQDGQLYDVAIDNVFANGYRQGEQGVPAPLDAIRAGDHLQLCGQLYDRGVGIHFVHTNCGAAPAANHPDGWLKTVDGSGQVGPNLEAGTGFCSLFGSNARHRARR